MNIENKTIILTGARRIGQTVAVELAKKGANLAITYRSSKEESEAMCSACLQHGVKAVPFQADLSVEEEIIRMVRQVKEEFGRIDGLVHMAAPYPKTLWDEVTMEQLIEIYRSIAGSAMILGREVGKVLINNQGDDIIGDEGEVIGNIKGKIILFSDWSIMRPYIEFAAYNSAKIAVEGYTRTLAKALAPGVLVNCIAPGPILRPPGLPEEENLEVMAKTLVKRWLGAKEIAKAAIYLFDADGVTGHILNVDGGRSIG